MHRCRALLFNLIVLATLLVAGRVLAEGKLVPSPLTRLASTLESESALVRADFAAVALSEMIAAYELEFDKLNLSGQVSRAEFAKQTRWARAVQQYLDDIYAALDDLNAGAPVELLVSLPAAVQLMIGDRLVAISSPRMDKAQILEQQIVQTYCDDFLCASDLQEVSVPAPSYFEKRGIWRFMSGEGSVYETADGLEFMFTDLGERYRKEQICLQVAEELNRLSIALADAHRQGRIIDMQALRVISSRHGGDQLVVLSASGDDVSVYLPALLNAPIVVEVAREWIAARSEGRAYRQRFANAELMLATLLAER